MIIMCIKVTPAGICAYKLQFRTVIARFTVIIIVSILKAEIQLMPTDNPSHLPFHINYKS